VAKISIGSLFGEISLRTEKFEAGIKKANRNLSQFGRNMNNVGRDMTIGIGAPLVGLGVLATKTFAEFGQSMQRVKAVSGATGAEFAALEQNAKDLGASTRFTASNVADLQLAFSKLGLKPDQILDATEATTNLALSQEAELGRAAEVAASTMRGFNLEAQDMKKITDVMAKSFTSSALDLEKFAIGMANSQTSARIFGLGLEETSAMLATLADRGIDASKAGTDLRKIFTDLSKEGITLEQAFDMVNESSDKSGTAFDLVGARAKDSLIILAEQEDTLRDLALSFFDSEDAAKNMAATIDDSLTGDLMKVRSAAEAVAIAMREELEPRIRAVAQAVAAFLQNNQGLIASLATTGVKIGLVVSLIGVAFMGLGKFAFAVVNINNLLVMMSSKLRLAIIALKSFNLVLLKTTILSIIASAKFYLILAAIVAVVAGVVFAVKAFMQWEEGVNAVKRAALFMQKGFIMAVLAIKDAVVFLHEKVFGPVFTAVFDFIKNTFTQVKNVIVEAIGKARDFIVKAFQKITEPVAEVFNKVVDGIKNAFFSVIEFFQTQLNKLAEKFPNVFGKLKGSLDKVKEGFNGLKLKTQDYFQDLDKRSGDVQDNMNETLGTTLKGWKETLADIKKSLSGMELNPELEEQLAAAMDQTAQMQEVIMPSKEDLFTGTGEKEEEEDDRVRTLGDAVKAFSGDAETMGELALHSMERASDGMTDALMGFFDGSKSSFKDFVADFLRQTARMILQTQVVNKAVAGIGSMFSGGGGKGGFLSSLGGLFGGGGKGGGFLSGIGKVFGGFFANGGPVVGGQPIVVGERGPEIYTPRQSGAIIPNGGSTGAGPVTVNFKVDAVDAASFNSHMLKNKELLISVVDSAMHKRAKVGING
tara:strand:- start:6011 stop:8635 length:2625 start_codon:yes stop_codon:yes gene_type:complete